jgi:hypothetical protein
MYTRKTQDEWQLLGNYGQGYEEVTAAETYRDIRQYIKDYRANEPGVTFIIRCKRIPIYEPGEAINYRVVPTVGTVFDPALDNQD